MNVFVTEEATKSLLTMNSMEEVAVVVELPSISAYFVADNQLRISCLSVIS